MRSWLVAVVSLAAGCEDEANTGPVSVATAERGCAQVCAFREACSGAADFDGCVERCIDDVTPWVRSDAFTAFTTCIDDLACDAVEDDCLDRVIPLAVHRQWAGECRMQLAACEGASPAACEFEGDADSIVPFIAEPIMNELVACLGGIDCAARVACVAAVVETYAIDQLDLEP